jgi:hypothetical protein
MPGVSFVGSTGNQDINGILSGVRWTPNSLTFSFPSSASFYGSNYGEGEPNNGFAQLNSTQQSVVRTIFQNYSAVANLTFTEITETASTHADLRFAKSLVPSTAWAYYPWTGAEGGDSWYRNSSTYNNPVKGNYAYLTFVHEIGHALGLKHGHETDTYGAMTTAHDSMEYSVMTYRGYVGAPTSGGYTNETWGYTQSLMMYDIAALQTMYGANYNTNSGNTTYNWSQTTGELFVNGVGQGAPGGNRIFMTIWDGNGFDVYNFSNYTTNVTVNLAPGNWTTTSTAQLAHLDYWDANTHIAAGNIANALLFNNNTQSLIEAAYGGSGNDTIVGNQTNNTLRGNGGNDALNGDAGTDTALFSGNRAQYQITLQGNGSWQVVDLRNGSPDGTDTLTSVEYFQFADQLFSTLNNPPVVTVSNKAIANGSSVAASTLFSVTDPDGDTIVTYRLYDQSPDSASGHFLVNGVQQGTNQNINLTASQLAQTTYVAGSAHDRLWVQVYDGAAWSQWYEFYNYPPVPPPPAQNHAPTVAVSNRAIASEASVAASTLFSVTDVDGDAIVTYRLYDQSPESASGHFLVNGVQQGTNQNINLTASQLAQTTYMAGSVQDHLWVQVYDGAAWSQWYEFYNYPPVPPPPPPPSAENDAPVVTVANKAMAADSSIAASSLFLVDDPDGDAITIYRFYDQSPNASSGRFLLNSVDQGYNHNIDLTPAQLAQTVFQAGSVQDHLWVQLYDGAEWSPWYEFYVNPPSGQQQAPQVTVVNKTMDANDTVAAGSLFLFNDPNGDAIVTYRLYDQSSNASSGRFLLNGVDQGYNHNIDLTAAQLAQTVFQAGSVQDHLWVQLFDGTAWSPWFEFFINPPNPNAGFGEHGPDPFPVEVGGLDDFALHPNDFTPLAQYDPLTLGL